MRGEGGCEGGRSVGEKGGEVLEQKWKTALTSCNNCVLTRLPPDGSAPSEAAPLPLARHGRPQLPGQAPPQHLLPGQATPTSLSL